MRPKYADAARPDFPKPNCRVYLVCGPPASGKSTYVKTHAASNDIVIDLDLIALELGHDRQSQVGLSLAERNTRLGALARESKDRVAWVIVSAPSERLRQWWRDALNAEKVVLLIPSRTVLRERMSMRKASMELVDKWFARELTNDPGIVKSGCDENGMPLDPLHYWNRNATDEHPAK